MLRLFTVSKIASCKARLLPETLFADVGVQVERAQEDSTSVEMSAVLGQEQRSMLLRIVVVDLQ